MVKALIVGISKYFHKGAEPLSECRNDILAMQIAMINGLNVSVNEITVLGENEIVYLTDFIQSFETISNTLSELDTFIVYFSGHGYKQDNMNYLVFSDRILPMDSFIERIDSIPCKNKIVMLDCCYAGNNNINLGSPIDLDETLDKFVGHGCAVMASCDFDETSGFDHKRYMSLYTRILCDALTNPFLIKQGKKSLEDIKLHIDRQADIANKSLKKNQNNAFRSSIVGTVYFDVEEYKPYKSAKIYKETDRYIIYSVEPTHANVKRISLKVILRFPCSAEEIANIAKEINQEALYYEVFNNEISENRWHGNPNNIIFAYYGYDEEDMTNGIFAFRSVWVDKNQDKNYWYRTSEKSSVINDISIEENETYSFIKKITTDNSSDDETLVERTRSCMIKMIIAAEKFIGVYREYINRTITEEDLITQTKDLSAEIRSLYFEQTDLPIASKDLHNWSSAYSSLAAVIDNFVIAYDQNTKRDSNNRKQLMDMTIKRYNECLENVKQLDLELADRINY